MFKNSSSLIAACGVMGLAAGVGNAAEFYVGEPVVRNDMQLSPAYLVGIEMNRMPDGQAHAHGDTVHFEIDVHGAKDEKHGFAEDEWIPYLSIFTTVEKIGADFKQARPLLPMQAIDGPHYANNFTMDGPGQYKITYHIEPPGVAGYIWHVDKETGIPPWWAPFEVSWTFTYPSKAN